MKTIPLLGGRTASAAGRTSRAGALTGRALVAAAASTFALLNGADAPLAIDTGGVCRPGEVALANASRFVETYFDEPLTTYAVGFRDTSDLDASLDFFAPKTPSPRRFTYKTQTNAEEFYSDTGDDSDIRAIGGEFKRVEYTGGEVEAKTYNKGLMVVVDLDSVTPGWEQRTVAKLMRRLKRNELRRSIALISAAATNTAKTWDTTAGKDPDQDVIADLITAGDSSGVAPNRVGYGLTAWSKRGLSHRAQNTAGGFASASLTPQSLAGILGVESCYVSRERYQSGAAAKTQIVANLVLMFNAMSNADLEDSSNIKRFVSPVEGGGDFRVYVQQISSKLVAVTVEHNSLIAITSTLGIRKFTVS
jgi:hypothetical protein